MESAAELAALRESIVDVLTKKCGTEAVLRYIASGTPFDNALWTAASELGWTALGVPDAYGGLGLGLDALAVLQDALGWAVAPIPMLATQLAAAAIALGGSESIRTTYLPEIAAGRMRASLSLPGAPGDLRYMLDGDAVVVDGVQTELLDASTADLLVVTATGLNGDKRRVLILPDADRVRVDQHRVVDPTRSFGSIDCTGLRLPAARLFEERDIEDALALHTDIALASEAVGVGDAALALAIDYLKIREQFGRVIGSFQALKHRVADHKTALLAARALVEEAVAVKAQPLAAAARTYACAVSGDVCRDVIQLHGGIGFTWDYPAHLFLKRALVNQAMSGGASAGWDRVADALAA